MWQKLLLVRTFLNISTPLFRKWHLWVLVSMSELRCYDFGGHLYSKNGCYILVLEPSKRGSVKKCSCFSGLVSFQLHEKFGSSARFLSRRPTLLKFAVNFVFVGGSNLLFVRSTFFAPHWRINLLQLRLLFFFILKLPFDVHNSCMQKTRSPVYYVCGVAV